MTKLITPIGLISYPFLFRPRKSDKPGKANTYETGLVFSHDVLETPEYKALVAAVTKVGQEKFGDRFKDLLEDGKLKMPLRKDVKSSGYDPTRFARFISARNYESPNHPRPGIIDRNKNEVTDPTTVFPGVRARLSVTVYGFDNESKGVALALNNVQIIGNKKDPRLDNRVEAKDEFSDLPPDADDAATGGGDAADDLASMLG